MTFNPAMFGIDSQQLHVAHELGKRLRVEVTKCPGEGWVQIRYVALDPDNPQSQATIANCVEGFAMQIAIMHDTFFGMKGKIIQE